MLEQVTYETTAQPVRRDLSNGKIFFIISLQFASQKIAHLEIEKKKGNAEMGRKRSTFRKQFAKMTFRKTTELIRFTHARRYTHTMPSARSLFERKSFHVEREPKSRCHTNSLSLLLSTDFHFVIHQVSSNRSDWILSFCLLTTLFDVVPHFVIYEVTRNA